MKKIIFACLACIAMASCQKEKGVRPEEVITLSSVDTLLFGKTTNTFKSPGNGHPNGVFYMSVPFAITAGGKDIFIPFQGILVSPRTSGPGISQYIQGKVENQYCVLFADETTSYPEIIISPSGFGTSTDHGRFKIPAHTTVIFTAMITYNPSIPGKYRAKITSIPYNTDNSDKYIQFAKGLERAEFTTPYAQTGF